MSKRSKKKNNKITCCIDDCDQRAEYCPNVDYRHMSYRELTRIAVCRDHRSTIASRVYILAEVIIKAIKYFGGKQAWIKGIRNTAQPLGDAPSKRYPRERTPVVTYRGKKR